MILSYPAVCLFLQVQRLQLAMLEMQQSQVQDTFGMTR